MSVPDPAVEAMNESLEAGPAGSWQQAAGIFSAIATMLSSTADDADRQSRANLIQQLDELETTLRNGGADDSDRLKTELARLEAELRVWRGMPGEAPGHAAAPQTDGPGIDGGGGALGAETGEGTGSAAALPFFDESRVAPSVSNLGESIGSPERFDRLTRNVQDSFALGGARADRPLAGRSDSPNPVPDRFLAASNDAVDFDALSKRIEASHRQLAARLEAGLASAANEANTLKDLITGAARTNEQARDADLGHRAGASLEREITDLAGRLDRAAEGFASLTSLERAIDGLSVQLEETRRIASGLSSASAGLATAGSGEPASGHGDDTQSVLREIAAMGTLHENAWQRLHVTLADIQQSVEQIAKATSGGAVLHGSGLAAASDPFAPILTSLAQPSLTQPSFAQHGQDGSLAARIIRPGAGEKGAHGKEILPPGEALGAGRPQAGGTYQPGDAASGQPNDGATEAGSFLIEPGLGFPGRDGDAQTPGQSNGPPKVSYDREAGAGRTDFIAAARRAARAAQLQGAAAPSGIGTDGVPNPGMEDDSVAAPGVVSLRRSGRGFLVHYRRPLVFGGVLLIAAIGAYAATLAHAPFGDFVPGLLKQFERGAVRAKPAAAKEAPANTPVARQTLLSSPSVTQSPAGRPQASEQQTGGASIPAAIAVASRDPQALAEANLSPNAATRSATAPPSTLSATTCLIAGGDAIVADTLDTAGRRNGAGTSARPRPAAVFPLDTVLQNAATAAAASPPARADARNLIDEAKSGNAAAQFELAVRFAEGSTGERNYEMAAQWYGKAAEQGLATAQYRLAALYERGLGVTQDMQRAKTLYQRSAEKGNTRAMHNLGVLAVESADGKPNYTSAALWFGNAAEYGVRDSQYNLAVLLARGLGLPKDLVKSYTWFAIVAAAGDPGAAKKRDDVAARLTSSELAAANAAAAAFVPRAADQAANEAAPPAVRLEASPAKPGQPLKPKLSGL